MQPRITVVTLGVDDLERSLRFYRDGLGLSTAGIVGQEFEYGAVVFIELQSGLRLALWPRESIAHDTGLSRGAPSSTEFTLGHNVSSRAEVDAVIEQAASAGATIVKPPQETFWVVTQAIFKTRTATCGRWSGTRSGQCQIERSQGPYSGLTRSTSQLWALTPMLGWINL